jgi:D-alanyl-D-alanine carboxypeptidase
MAKNRLRPGRVVFAMGMIVGSVILLDNLKRDLFRTNTDLVVSGNFRSGSAQYVEIPTESQRVLGNEPQTATAFNGVQNLGFNELNLPSSRLSAGALVIVDDKKTAGELSASGKVNLFKEKNEYYSLMDNNVMLDQEAAEALNQMMADYHTATALSDFIVYGTTDTYTGDGSLCPRHFPESAMGNTVDLALNGYGSVLAFDGYDEQGWVLDNCAKYGFIVRYPQGKKEMTSYDYCPWHLRYVGGVHAAIMTEKNFCLEEYLDFLKNYTFDNALAYNLNGVNYEIYSVVSQGDSTPVRVPVSGDYTISGNNSDRYIITAIKN